MEILAPSFLLKLVLYLYAFGAVAALAAMRKERLANFVGFGSATAAGVCGMAASVSALLSARAGDAANFQLWPSGIPYLHLTVNLDALSSFFLLIVSVVELAISLYSFGFARASYGRKNIGLLAALYNGLLLSITLVFTAGNAFFFLIVWELMALTSFCLVTFEHEKTE